MKKPAAHYALLGCPPAAEDGQLHQAYLELAFKHHPDRQGDVEQFKAVAAAWGILKNREFRARYDAELKLLGLNCGACTGRGLVYQSVGFTGRKERRCPACRGTGRNDL